MDLTELDMVSVQPGAEEGWWDVYVPLVPGDDRAEWWGAASGEQLAAAEGEGLEVYDRRTGQTWSDQARK